MEPLVNYFKGIEINSVLDIGTGSGAFLKVLNKIFPKAHITGIDPNSESLENARKFFPDVTFLEMEAGNMSFDDNTFDVVAISMALHHLPKVKKALREMNRVVKPDGYVIISEIISNNLNPAQEVHKLFHHFRSRIDRLTGSFHRKTFSSDAILNLLKQTELPVQFYFEHRSNMNLLEDDSELEFKVERMRQMIEKIKGRPEYDLLYPQIEEFRKKAMEHGLQAPTKLVIVCRKKVLS